jgi:hypothetical protein
MAYRPERGWGFDHKPGQPAASAEASAQAEQSKSGEPGSTAVASPAGPPPEWEELKRRLTEIEAKLGIGAA